jgi:hypothetical protein
VQPLWKSVWRFFNKVKIELPYYPAIPFLGIYLKECKSAYNRDTCIPMFIAAWFIIDKLWNQPKCPPTNDWIKKMWCIHTIEYYSIIKKKEIMSFAGKWMQLDKSGSGKNIACFLSYVSRQKLIIIIMVIWHDYKRENGGETRGRKRGKRMRWGQFDLSTSYMYDGNITMKLLFIVILYKYYPNSI